jgi:hypothetical protein
MSDTAVTPGRSLKLSASLLAAIAALVLIAFPGVALAAGKQPRLTNGIERFSANLSEKHPYFGCPPATEGRVSCQAVIVPAAAKPAIRAERKALELVGKGASPALEGGGIEGGFSPTDLRSA